MPRSLLAPFLAFALAACGSSGAGDEQPLAVSIIGPAPLARPDPNRRALAPVDAALLAATAQGLVRFDAGGQIEPGLAARWDVSDDGLYYTFRLRPGSGIDAERAAARLRRALARSSRNALRPILGAISEIVAVTPEVIEIRLAAPRPNLLQLFAQAELAIPVAGAGGGPMRLAGTGGGALRLLPVADPDAAEDDAPGPRDEIRLRGERAALALARFAAGQAAIVTGGTFADLPIARAVPGPQRALRFDPAAGLFGLEVLRSEGFLAAAENRRALAAAIDRDRLVAAFGVDGWRGIAALLPVPTELATPAAPDWAGLPLGARRARAAMTVSAWPGEDAAPLLRIALPEGPGARLLFAQLAADWRAVGILAVAVGRNEAADLRLVDRVAPGDIATWYLRQFACGRAAVCSAQADAALEAARTTPSIPERQRLLLAANRALEETVPFIPLATPLRWSMVPPALRNWQDNARAVHPLYTLRRRD